MDRALREYTRPEFYNKVGKLMKNYISWCIVVVIVVAAAIGVTSIGYIVSQLDQPVQAQQTPFTMYPLHAKVQVPFTDQELDVEQCLVVTAQGHAVVLEYPCPR